MTLRAARVEATALAWAEALGYAVLQGPAIAVCESAAEHRDLNDRDALLHKRIFGALRIRDADRVIGEHG